MIGNKIHALAAALWPINRSITGDGVRDTLNAISKHIPNLVVESISSGTPVFDWTVPQEWKVKEAYIKTPSGDILCSFSSNNLHLVGYSEPFNGLMQKADLLKHLYTLEDQPTAIPYVTSYYKKDWGFAIAYEDYCVLEDGIYEVCIDSSFCDGALNYGEVYFAGTSKKEILLSSYICHPSMANNELSGPCVLTFLAEYIQNIPNRYYSYRIVFIPETIGSISYISRNLDKLKDNVIAGFNLSCIGDERAYSCVHTRYSNTFADRVVAKVATNEGLEIKNYGWLSRGSDERQYNAPNVNLPIVTICRSKFGEYPEYHTSLDNLTEVVTPAGLGGGYDFCTRLLDYAEKSRFPMTKMLCEPQMGKRDLYSSISYSGSSNDWQYLLDVLSYCDGSNNHDDIAALVGISEDVVDDAVAILIENELVFVL